MEDRKKVLEVKDLAVSFRGASGTVQAVRGVSFDLTRGETIAIVGESGSGKSVSVKTIMGILAKNGRIERGEILFDGMDLTKVKEDKFHTIRGKRIGLVFQDPLSALNPLMKVGKQIMEVLLLDRRHSREEARRKALELMKAVGISDAEERFEQYPFQFSGGMRQRIVIAIALANEPEILICDEPTTALDVTVQARILELIQDIRKKWNLTIIFITHDLGVVANIADRVYVMYAGKIVEYGTCEEIFFDPRHPYTWALLSSIPDMESKERLAAIPGTPPNMVCPPKGDGFAARSQYAMAIDLEEEPPMFPVSPTHGAATWLLHPDAPRVELPEALQRRIARMRREGEKVGGK